MIGLKKSEIIGSYLDSLYPNPRCELNYVKDYELLIAVVLSAQTTDKRVNSVTPLLFTKYKTLKDLAEADLECLEEIIRPLGTFHKKAIFITKIATELHNNYSDTVPLDHKKLMKLSGVGRKTANVVLSNLSNYPAIAVDTHVERISKRLGLAKKNDDVLAIEKKLMKVFDKKVWSRRHHQLVLFGRYHCKAMVPNCNNCQLTEICKKYTDSD